MSDRTHRQGLKIVALKSKVKGLKRRMKECKTVEREIDEYLDKLKEEYLNVIWKPTLDRINRTFKRKEQVLDRVTLMVNKLVEMWEHVYEDNANNVGRYQDGRTSPTGSSVIRDWDIVELMVDNYVELLDTLSKMVEEEKVVLNRLFNEVDKNWISWYRHQKSLRF